jgi:hypothetical protein
VSRHEVPARYDHHRVFVGFDNVLGTFYLQVYDIDQHSPVDDAGRHAVMSPPITYFGLRAKELTTVLQLKRVSFPYARLTDEVLAQLDMEMIDATAHSSAGDRSP